VIRCPDRAGGHFRTRTLEFAAKIQVTDVQPGDGRFESFRLVLSRSLIHVTKGNILIGGRIARLR
jgi:hypothetical protein